MTSCFHTMGPMGQNCHDVIFHFEYVRKVAVAAGRQCLIEFIRMRNRGRSLLSMIALLLSCNCSNITYGKILCISVCSRLLFDALLKKQLRIICVSRDKKWGGGARAYSILIEVRRIMEKKAYGICCWVRSAWRDTDRSRRSRRQTGPRSDQSPDSADWAELDRLQPCSTTTVTHPRAHRARRCTTGEILPHEYRWSSLIVEAARLHRRWREILVKSRYAVKFS